MAPSEHIVKTGYLYNNVINHHYQKFTEQTIQKPGRGEDGNDQYDETFIRHFPAEVLKRLFENNDNYDAMVKEITDIGDNNVTVGLRDDAIREFGAAHLDKDNILELLQKLKDAINNSDNKHIPLNEIIKYTLEKEEQNILKKIFGYTSTLEETHIAGSISEVIKDDEIINALNILRDYIMCSPKETSLDEIVKALRGETLSILKEILSDDERFCSHDECNEEIPIDGICVVHYMFGVQIRDFFTIFNNPPIDTTVTDTLTVLKQKIKNSPAGESIGEIVKGMDNPEKNALLNILGSHKTISILMNAITTTITPIVTKFEITIVSTDGLENALYIMKKKIDTIKDDRKDENSTATIYGGEEPIDLSEIMGLVTPIIVNKKHIKMIKNAFLNDLSFNNMITHMKDTLSNVVIAATTAVIAAEADLEAAVIAAPGTHATALLDDVADAKSSLKIFESLQKSDDIIKAFKLLQKEIKTSKLTEDLDVIIKKLVKDLDSKIIMLQEFFVKQDFIDAMKDKCKDGTIVTTAPKEDAIEALKQSIDVKKSLYENVNKISEDNQIILLDIFKNFDYIQKVKTIDSVPGGIYFGANSKHNPSDIKDMFDILHKVANRATKFADIFKTPLQILEIVFRNEKFGENLYPEDSASINYKYEDDKNSNIIRAFYSLQSSLVPPFLETLKKNSDQDLKNLKAVLGTTGNNTLFKGYITVKLASKIGYSQTYLHLVLDKLYNYISGNWDSLTEYMYSTDPLITILEKTFPEYIPALQAILGNTEIINFFNNPDPIAYGQQNQPRRDRYTSPEVGPIVLSQANITAQLKKIKDSIQNAPIINKQNLDTILSNMGGSMERRKYRNKPENIYCFYNLYPLYCLHNYYYFKYTTDLKTVTYDNMQTDDTFKNNFMFSKHTLLKLYNSQKIEHFSKNNSKSEKFEKNFSNLYYVIGRQNIFFDYKNNDNKYSNDETPPRMFGFNENSVLPKTVSLILFLTDSKGVFRNHLFYGLRINNTTNINPGEDDGQINQINAHFYFYILKPTGYPNIIIPSPNTSSAFNDCVLNNYGDIENTIKKLTNKRINDSEMDSYIKVLNEFLESMSGVLSNILEDKSRICEPDFVELRTSLNFQDSMLDNKPAIRPDIKSKIETVETVDIFNKFDSNMLLDIKPFFKSLYNIYGVPDTERYIKINKYLFDNFLIEILLLDDTGKQKTFNIKTPAVSLLDDDLYNRTTVKTIPDNYDNAPTGDFLSSLESNTVINLHCINIIIEKKKTFYKSWVSKKQFEQTLYFFKHFYEKQIISEEYQETDILSVVDQIINNLLNANLTNQTAYLKLIYKIFISPYLDKNFNISITN